MANHLNGGEQILRTGSAAPKLEVKNRKGDWLSGYELLGTASLIERGDQQSSSPQDTPANWRALLPELEALPLLPCNGKRPTIAGWQTAAYSPQQITALGETITGCGTRTGRDAGGLLAFDLDGAAAIAWAIEQGCDPAAAETWQIVRSSDTNRLKVLWSVPIELWHVLGDVHTNRQLKPAVKDPTDGRILHKGEGIELYFGKGQILLLGLHPESGRQYEWKGCPSELAEIPPEWWVLALELADSAAPQKEGQASRSSTGSGAWRRLQRCPICGRTERIVCQKHQDGQTIRCFHGSTFHPPDGLAVGKLIPGTPWAFCRVQSVGWAEFSIFRRHQPRAATFARTWRVGGGRRG